MLKRFAGFSLKETFRTNNSMSSYSSALSNPANNGNCNHNVLRNQNLLTLSDLKIHNDYLNVINEAGVVSSSPSFLAALELETKEKYPKICHQSISKFQGRFFSFLSQKTNPQRILELGCFTGYSTLCLAEGLSPDPGNEGREKCWSWQGVHDDRLIMTCDVNRDAMEIASRYFKASPYASFFRLFPGDASEMLEMLKESGQKPFDLIFIDADKGNYIRYFETIMAAKLLSPKGIIIADNVLFRHLVPEVASITTDSHVGKGKDKTSLKDKIQKIARSMHKFNEHVSADDRVNYLLLPIFDGIGLIWLK